MVRRLRLICWPQSKHGKWEVDKKDVCKQQEVEALGRVVDKVACRASKVEVVGN